MLESHTSSAVLKEFQFLSGIQLHLMMQKTHNCIIPFICISFSWRCFATFKFGVIFLPRYLQLILLCKTLFPILIFRFSFSVFTLYLSLNTTIPLLLCLYFNCHLLRNLSITWSIPFSSFSLSDITNISSIKNNDVMRYKYLVPYNIDVDITGPFKTYFRHNKTTTLKIWLVVFCCTTSTINIKVMEDCSF